MNPRLAALIMLALIPAAPRAADTPAADAGRQVVMYKTPACGCCDQWADHLRSSGFTVETRASDALESIKDAHGVPASLRSCHTAEIDGYVIEGHVPAADIMRLLKDRPAGVRVLTVPGMPLGSPGMEHPRPQDFITIAVHDDGTATIYAEHPAGEDFGSEAH